MKHGMVIIFIVAAVGLLKFTNTQIELAEVEKHQQPKVWLKFVKELISECIAERFITVPYCTKHRPTGSWRIRDRGRDIIIKTLFGYGIKNKAHFQTCYSNRGVNIINFLKFIITRARTFHVLQNVFRSRHQHQLKRKTIVKNLVFARNINSYGDGSP